MYIDRVPAGAGGATPPAHAPGQGLAPGARAGLPRVAIIGSGISGLAAAHGLREAAQITLFEAGDYFGGHTHTVDVTLPGAQGPVTHGVDTGFLVFNERTYPQLIALFAGLGVATAPSDMSFSVQVPGAGHAAGAPALEWSGSDLNTVFAQRRNLLRPAFWRMLADVVRFNALATRLAQSMLRHEANPALGAADQRLWMPLGDFLRREGYSDAFRDWYFLPMIGCIWSCPTDQMLQFPVATMVRFCHNHGLIQLTQRPQWHTVRGGARHYVERIVQGIPDRRLSQPVRAVRRQPAGGVQVHTDAQVETFDEVVLACHSDQALALLGEHASAAEREVLGAIRYQPNRAVLHTDVSVMPRRPLAWAAWNYERAADADRERASVCLHYWLNRLQPLPFAQPVIVSLNPVRPIDPATIVGEYDYAHPVFDLAAIRAQQRLPAIQGQGGVHFCGAWAGYGFHEDGLKSGLLAAQGVRERVGR